MRSSTSSSSGRANHSFWTGSLLAISSFALLALPEWSVSILHARRVVAARQAIEQIMPLSDSGPGEAEFEHVRRALHEKPAPAVVFVGNSIMRTGVLPAVVRDGLSVAPWVSVLHLGLDGYPPGLPFEAMLQARWRPNLLIVDIEPRNFRLEKRSEVLNLLRAPRTSHSHETAESALARVFHTWFPFAAQPRNAVEQLRRIGLWFSDPSGFRLQYARRVEGFVALDGSKPTWLFEDSPSARATSIERSASMIRNTSGNAREVLQRFLDGARLFVRDGSRVVFVSMPTSRELRDVDAEVNSSHQRWFRREVARLKGMDFVDLGADARLAELPFFDGHHRAFPVAIEASERIGELLANSLPTELRRVEKQAPADSTVSDP